MYARALTEVLAAKGDPTNGTAILQRIRGHNFMSLRGHMVRFGYVKLCSQIKSVTYLASRYESRKLWRKLTAADRPMPPPVPPVHRRTVTSDNRTCRSRESHTSPPPDGHLWHPHTPNLSVALSGRASSPHPPALGRGPPQAADWQVDPPARPGKLQRGAPSRRVTHYTTNFHQDFGFKDILLTDLVISWLEQYSRGHLISAPRGQIWMLIFTLSNFDANMPHP